MNFAFVVLKKTNKIIINENLNKEKCLLNPVTRHKKRATFFNVTL
jgi:hypothetical protein